MTKTFLTIITLLLLTSCNSIATKEVEKSAKASSASSRINAGQNNSQSILKDLDE